MRAIIITDAESLMLLDRLELAKLREEGLYRNSDTTHEAMAEAHRVFHYQVVRWLQDIGCDLKR